MSKNVQIIQYLDGLIHLEVLKRASFPIKVCPFDSSCLEVHKRHMIELQNLYKEVTEEIHAQYLGEKDGIPNI